METVDAALALDYPFLGERLVAGDYQHWYERAAITCTVTRDAIVCPFTAIVFFPTCLFCIFFLSQILSDVEIQFFLLPPVETHVSSCIDDVLSVSCFSNKLIKRTFQQWVISRQ